MTCSHTETFDCHGTERCSTCYLDSYLLSDGTRFWPAQEHPDEWDDDRVAQWFLDNKIYLLNQGCEGFTFCRTSAEPSTYGYIWVEVVLDLDYQFAYLLDVRRNNGTDETRRYVFVAFGAFQELQRIESHYLTEAIFSGHGRERLLSGLHWFAEQVGVWLRKDDNERD